MKKGICLIVLAGLAAAAGCDGAGGISLRRGDYVKPTIAVMKFENRSSLPLGWNVGDGMKDVLVDRLCETDRFQVIERPELDLIMKELHFQQTGATRQHNRAKLGRIKNVQYLVKGTVTDFGHVSTKSGYFGWAENLDIFGTGNRAVMSMTMYVVDVESGEIVSSESIEESVRAKDLNVNVAYKNVGFGGSTFFRTPLGRVTAKVIDKAVKRIAKSVAGRPWEPKIAQVVSETSVILNGGRNRRVKIGSQYEVLEMGEPIVDPDTGDVIGTSAGQVIGRLRVSEVQPRYSVALIMAGNAGAMKVGQKCRPIKDTSPVAGAPATTPQGVKVTTGGDLLTDMGVRR